MKQAMTVMLGPEEQAAVDAAAEERGVGKSVIVRMCVRKLMREGRINFHETVTTSNSTKPNEA